MSRLSSGCLSLALLAFLSPSFISAQTEPSGSAPAQSTKAAENGSSDVAPKPDYSKEAFVIERWYERYRFENDGTGRKTSILRVHVLSEGGLKAFGQLRFGYNSANDRLEIVQVKVTKSDGTVVTAGPDAVQDLTAPVQQIAPVYTDYREKHVTVPGLRPGDTLECEVATTLQTPAARGQFWMQHDFNQTSVVLDEQLEVDVPAGRSLKLKSKPGHDPEITEEKGRRIYRWASSHLTPAGEGADKDQDKASKKKKTDEFPDVQMSTFTSWEEVGRWYAALEKDRRVPSSDVRAKAGALTHGLTSDLEKTQALYDFVAQNFRYVSLSLGIGRYQPQAAADVLRNQYGDCKDKHTLLAALLEAEGLHASSVLINSFRKLDPDVPSPSQFNHVITMVPIGNEEVWLDTTTEVAPFRLLAYPLRKKQALVIPANGLARLQETPGDPPTPNTQVDVVEGKVDDTGRLEARVSETLRGDTELALRIVFRAVPASKWQSLVETGNKTLGGDVTNIKVSEPTATREPFTISYNVSKANFVDWSKKKSEVKLPLASMMLMPVASDVGESTDAADSAAPEPFKIGPPNVHTYHLKLELAPRYRPSAPVPISLERDFGAYQSTYTLDGNTFSAERKLTLRLGELPPPRANDYRAFRRNVLADGTQVLTIESSVADTHSPPTNLKPAELVRDGNDARKKGNYQLAIDLYNRAIEADPKNKDAWNDLGLAYFDEWQDGLAINAYQKQIEINPYDQYAYNNLGRVYLRQRKYEEADKWFNKQIEIQPLDKYAHSNLGISLIEQHKYEDAIPELEKAISISPNIAGYQINLGRAYLNLGQDEKAIAAFDKALSITANPSTWNLIAYYLSLKAVHLDRARSYAESAVSSTAASLRNISLEQIKQEDATRTASLSAYWDTLGWVAFAEGKLDVAERYVLAAWQLAQHADEADHLGQIYEKRGRKADAARFYAIALNARRPEPELRARLSALIGPDKLDAEVEKHRNQSQESRMLNIANPSSMEGKADFFVVLSPSSARAPAVDAVSFANGEEKLKSFTDSLRSTKFVQTFPDDTPVKIVRRGTLTCKPGAECTFVLALPQDVRSID